MFHVKLAFTVKQSRHTLLSVDQGILLNLPVESIFNHDNLHNILYNLLILKTNG